MKKFFTLFVALVALFTLGATEQAMASEEPTTTESNQRIIFSSYYTGTIGDNLHITMYLGRWSTGVYAGWYYYNKYGSNNKLELVGEKAADGLVTLYEYNADDQLTGRFEGTFNRNGEFIGIMYVVHTGKRHSFRLYPANF